MIQISHLDDAFSRILELQASLVEGQQLIKRSEKEKEKAKEKK